MGPAFAKLNSFLLLFTISRKSFNGFKTPLGVIPNEARRSVAVIHQGTADS
jgi:hypothetical protein